MRASGSKGAGTRRHWSKSASSLHSYSTDYPRRAWIERHTENRRRANSAASAPRAQATARISRRTNQPARRAARRAIPTTDRQREHAAPTRVHRAPTPRTGNGPGDARNNRHRRRFDTTLPRRQAFPQGRVQELRAARHRRPPGSAARAPACLCCRAPTARSIRWPLGIFFYPAPYCSGCPDTFGVVAEQRRGIPALQAPLALPIRLPIAP